MPLKTIQTPGAYPDTSKKLSIFEDWNYLLVSADERYKLASLPGVISGQDAPTFITSNTPSVISLNF